MKYYFLLPLIFINFNPSVMGQGRKIDAQLRILRPNEGDTIISRRNGTYNSRFIIKNNGPDNLKISDKYSIEISFGNVLYGYFFRNPSRNIVSGSEDTVDALLYMYWDTDNYHTTFCGSIYLSGLGSDSIKSENKIELLNNKFCQKVAHDSRLYLKTIVKNKPVIYPNPSTGVIWIDYNKNAFNLISIKVTNNIGSVISTHKPYLDNNSLQLDLSYLINGLYSLELSDINNRILKTRILIHK